jgi:hypothetical protein
VAQFGPAILAAPPRKGFDLIAWWLPIAGLALGAAWVTAAISVLALAILLLAVGGWVAAALRAACSMPKRKVPSHPAAKPMSASRLTDLHAASRAR